MQRQRAATASALCLPATTAAAAPSALTCSAPNVWFSRPFGRYWSCLDSYIYSLVGNANSAMAVTLFFWRSNRSMQYIYIFFVTTVARWAGNQVSDQPGKSTQTNQPTKFTKSTDSQLLKRNKTAFRRRSGNKSVSMTRLIRNGMFTPRL